MTNPKSRLATVLRPHPRWPISRNRPAQEVTGGRPPLERDHPRRGPARLPQPERMTPIKATPSAFNPICQFDLPKAEGKCWTHPVISHGKLYLRWEGNLHVYDIQG